MLVPAKLMGKRKDFGQNKSTAPGIRKPSPILLLTQPSAVYMRSSDGIRSFLQRMAVPDSEKRKSGLIDVY